MGRKRKQNVPVLSYMTKARTKRPRMLLKRVATVLALLRSMTTPARSQYRRHTLYVTVSLKAEAGVNTFFWRLALLNPREHGLY